MMLGYDLGMVTEMSDVLTRIKRAVLAGDVVFTAKARYEMRADGLVEMDVIESIINAVAIQKKIRSTSDLRKHSKGVFVRYCQYEPERNAHLH